MYYLLAYLLIINATTFLVYGYDKYAARQKKSRVRESKLHLLAMIGGSSGALIAQQIFHHKTTKRSFQLIYWGTVVVQVAVVVWYLSR